MLPVDLATLALVSGVVSALQALSFAVVWCFNRRIAGVAHWGGATLLNGLALILMTTRTVVHQPVLTKALPNLMNVVADLLFFLGAAAFAGRRPSWRWPVALSVPLLLGFLWFLLVDDQPRIRPLLMQPILLMFLGLGAAELLRERRPGLRFSARLTGTAALLFSGVLLYRMIALALRPTGELFAPIGPQMALFAAYILWVLFWSFGTLMLINQRQILEIREASEAGLRAREEAAALEKEILAERAHRQRQLLVRDLHDGLGGITAHLSLLTSAPVTGEAPNGVVSRIQDIRQLAQEGNRELRLLMNTLERGVTHWGDFLAELRTHATKVCAAHGVALGWTVTGIPPAEPAEDVPAMLSLLRAVKEALNNAARHAHPTRLSARLAFHGHALGIAVRDDGCGFAGPDGRAGGRGLGNMRRRLEEMGGRCRIRSRPGEGTVVTFVLPLPVAIWPAPAQPAGALP